MTAKEKKEVEKEIKRLFYQRIRIVLKDNDEYENIVGGNMQHGGGNEIKGDFLASFLFTKPINMKDVKGVLLESGELLLPIESEQ